MGNYGNPGIRQEPKAIPGDVATRRLNVYDLNEADRDPFQRRR
jgi:hypothetical protein